MIYSVWNQGKSAYDYYESKQVQKTANTPSPRHLSSRGVGAPVEYAAWPLPSDARPVGSGPQARGRIASRSGGFSLGAFDLGSSGTKAVLLGIAGIILWRHLR